MMTESAGEVELKVGDEKLGGLQVGSGTHKTCSVMWFLQQFYGLG